MESLKQIGDIRIFAELQRGPVTHVYKGYQDSLERFVLLKVLRPELSRNSDLTQRFEEEAKYIARIQHPNVVAIYDYGRQEEWHYFATEFVEGWGLNQVISDERLPWELAAFIVRDVAKGLKAAHDVNLLHKDIKPANILIAATGQVKLTDFGLADLNSTEPIETDTPVCGTLGFIPPEVVLGEAPDQASDIFSLGVTLFEMVTGTPAFPRENAREYFDAVLNEEPIHYLKRQPSVPDGLVAICEKMLARNRRERYQDGGRLIQDLETFFTENGIAVGEPRLLTFLKDRPAFVPTRLDAVEAESRTDDPVASTEVKKPRRKRVYSYLFASLFFIVVIGWMAAALLDFDSEPAGENGQQAKPSVEAPPQRTSLEPSLPPERPDADKDESESALQDADTDTPNARPLTKADVAAERTSGHISPPEVEADMVTHFGYLHLKCTPWATVYIDGDSLGATPLNQPVRLAAGYHELRLVNPQFPDYQTRVRIQGDQATELEVSFWDRVGQLHLEVSPWAVVFVNGDSVDTVPPQERPFILKPGEHTLTLQHPVLGEWQTEFVISAGEKLDLKFNLRNLLTN